MDLYQRMSDRSMAKLYWIARHCGDFATANEILQALRQRIELGAERPKSTQGRGLVASCIASHE